MLEPIDMQIIMNQNNHRIHATDKEGSSWSEFHMFSHENNALSTKEKLQMLREKGYKIFIIPYENRIYDDYAKVVQYFDENGRGEILENY